MKKYVILTIGCLFFILFPGCKIQSGNKVLKTQNMSRAEQNIYRAIELLDSTVSAHFVGDEMAMTRYYNPYTKVRSEEKGSVWMYTSAIEAVNAVLQALKTHQETGNTVLYNKHFNQYVQLLKDLYSNADYYLGTFNLVSYTQTAEWTVYGVHRAREKGKAKVEGIENVYDDQMWLVRELLHSYKLTGETSFLEKAEYLTEYVLDGWDCTIDSSGDEVGGIPWGPGYVTKHACSNGPMISPLVWLHEIYKEKNDIITHRYIDSLDRITRLNKSMKKSEYYLYFAEKIYDWQKRHLLRSDGVYDDFMGGCTPKIQKIEIIKGVEYRGSSVCRDRVGPAITYNSGTMLSGAVDLYRVTNDKQYYVDAVNLSQASFSYFAKSGAELSNYYSYDVSGFRNWFNGVLMRSYVDIYPFNGAVSEYIETFQQNLDYGYENFLHNGFLPTNLLVGWNKNVNENTTE